MRFADVIARKRDGRTLSRDEIARFVEGVTDGRVPDYQASALLMAIVLRGMSDQETAWLTDAMLGSGDRVDLSGIPGPKVGKHSTGGVGDKVSIVLGPVVAACGVVVPKMSGRGLGHTGGTLDKLESIPGLRVDLSIDAFTRQLREVGVAIVGQSASLVPADKKLYALRDVTATVESVPLIAASIMSKKLAEGSGALVLDVKCGDGAFMKDEADARALAAALVAIGRHAGVRTEAVITDMSIPLGCAVGNALEIAECLDVLQDSGPPAVVRLVTEIAARMLVVGGAAPDVEAARGAVTDALGSGRALDRFARLVAAQGGDVGIIEDRRRLPHVATQAVLTAERAGVIQAVPALAIGQASLLLGAGRDRAGEPVDHAVGVVLQVRPGDRVERGQPLVTLHHRDGHHLDTAMALCREAVAIGDEARPEREPILGEVR